MEDWVLEHQEDLLRDIENLSNKKDSQTKNLSNEKLIQALIATLSNNMLETEKVINLLNTIKQELQD